jgi:pyruvate formate lyase activating enzyme
LIENVEKHSFITGHIFNIQRFSLHDGPGIRTTVFFSGCGLRCPWCHNPECFSASSDKYAVNDLMEIIKRDMPFYINSGGGVTLSGGEPLIQYEFARKLLYSCKEIGIHTAMETAAFADWKAFESVIDFTDLFMIDIKLIDKLRHKEIVGQDNNIILHNIVKLSNAGAKVIIRIPIIPSINDDDENIINTGKFLLNNTSFRDIELLKYHSLAENKYLKLGYTYTEFPEGNKDNMKRLCGLLSNLGINVLNSSEYGE